MRRDLIFASLGIGVGSYLGYYMDSNLYILLGFLVLTIGLYLIFDKDYNFFFLALAMGMVLMGLRENSQILKNYTQGQVIGIIEAPLTSEEDYRSYEIQVNSIDSLTVDERAVIGFTGLVELNPGDLVQARVKVEEILDEGNPGLFNYKTHARISGIYTRLKAESYEVLGQRPSAFRDLKNKFHTYVTKELASPLEGENLNFMTDLFLNTDNISKDQKDLYSTLGLSHILAISGLHIGIISAFALYILKGLGIHAYLAQGLVIVLLGLYVYLVGFPASAIRALTMMVVASLATVLSRAYDPKKALALGVFLMVLVNPYRVFDLGLILSSMAILGLIYREKIFGFDKKTKLIETLEAIAAVNLFIFPILANSFNSFNLMTFLANLVTIPIFTLAALAGLLKLVVGLVFPQISLLIGIFIDQCLILISYLTSLMVDFDLLNLPLESGGFMVFIIYYFLLGLYIKRYDLRSLSLGFKEGIFKVFAANSLIMILLSYFADPLYVNFIDIGQGDSTLIEYYNKDLLIDTGGSIFQTDKSYEYTLRPYLEKNTSYPIQLIISHDDKDHSGNLDQLIEDSFVSKVYSSDYFKRSYWLGLRQGHKLKLGSAEIDVIFDGQGARESNDTSLVLRLEHYGTSILFTGDAGEFTETKLMEKRIESDVLKVGHHGSEKSSAPWFLERVGPKDAVISVGAKNTYGHPSPRVLEDLEKIGARVYRTDTQGNISLISTRFGYRINPYLPKKIDPINLGLALGLVATTSMVYLAYFTSLYKASRKTKIF